MPGDRRPRIALLGASGQLGRELHDRLALFGVIIAPSPRELDLGWLERIGPWIRSAAPDLIVNAAAYTAVDDAELDGERAHRVNGDAVGVIGAASAALGVPVVHYSTDYVYDGSGDAPRSETDPPNPINEYGASKLAGDRALLASGASALIFRTSWLYGYGSPNFVTTILRLARERTQIRVVDDQVGAPTSTELVACVTALVVQRGIGDLGGYLARHSGVVHLAAEGWTSRFGFAEEILDRALAAGALEVRPALVPTASADYPTTAARPKNSRLTLDRLRERFGITPPFWRDDLARHFRSLCGSRLRR